MKIELLTEANALNVLAWITPWALSSKVNSSNSELIDLIFDEINDTVSCISDSTMASLAPAVLTNNSLFNNISLNWRATIVTWFRPLNSNRIFS